MLKPARTLTPFLVVHLWLAGAVVSISALGQVLPSAGKLMAGQAQWQQNGTALSVVQTTPKAVIDWSSFNIAPQASVNFVQPSGSAVILNRVTGASPSVIAGRLSATGQVFISNPAGVLFGPSAQADVAALVATSLSTSTDAFMSGASIWQLQGNGSVSNQGNLSARAGGFVALMGPTVRNDGTIQAPMGTVALAAGDRVTLNMLGSQLIGVQVDQGSLNALIENRQVLRADGGQILLSAKAANELAQSVIKNEGTLQAQTLAQQAGRILLRTDPQRGTVLVGGKLDASAPVTGDGGFIETSGAQVKVNDSAQIDTRAAQGRTGKWLVDPQDFTVASIGGDITGAQLSRSLASTSVELQSVSGAQSGSGSLNINDAVSWSSNNALTLSATHNIRVSANVTATGPQTSLVLQPNTSLAGETASGQGQLLITPGAAISLPNVSPASRTALIISGTPYTVINQLGVEGSVTGTDLQGINGQLTGHFALGRSLDASATASWNNGAGFTPLGLNDPQNGFSGSFTGLGNSINQVTINNSSGVATGLFSQTSPQAVVGQVQLLGGTITGSTPNVGALIGTNAGQLINSASSSQVVLNNINGPDTQPTLNLGGLVGHNASTGRVGQSYFTGAASLYNNMDVTASNLGGVAGRNAGQVAQSFASATLRAYNPRNTPTETLGGLIGQNTREATVTDSFATSTLTSASNRSEAGTLIGHNEGLVARAYAQGTVSVPTPSTGVFGTNLSDNSAVAAPGSSLSGWNLTDTWLQYPGQAWPLLRAFLTPLSVAANDFTQVYNAQTYAGQAGVSYSRNPNAKLLGSLSFSTLPSGAKNVGTSPIQVQGLYSTDPLGYDIRYLSGSFTVTPATLSVSGLQVNTKYADGSPAATLSGQPSVQAFGNDVISVRGPASAQFSSPFVGASQNVEVQGFVLSGPDAGNYRVVNSETLKGDIRYFPQQRPASATQSASVPSVVPATFKRSQRAQELAAQAFPEARESTEPE